MFVIETDTKEGYRPLGTVVWFVEDPIEGGVFTRLKEHAKKYLTEEAARKDISKHHLTNVRIVSTGVQGKKK